MILKDYHIHTSYSDGKNSPEDIILAAIDKGFTEIGFSDHSYTEFDESYCMKKDLIDDYLNEIKSLKEKYRDRISVLCGIEQDYYSSQSTESYDYVIGSVHYVKVGENYIDVDHSKEKLIADVKTYFNGCFSDFYRAYYANLSDVVVKTGADIIGHFDLVAKFNEDGSLFDSKSEEYTAAWNKAADALLDTGKPFEINTGAISRGYKTNPYPANDIYEYLKNNGARFILSSDCHDKSYLGAYFENFEKLINNN